MTRAEGRPVLIVEDDVDIRDALQELLAHEGYPVVAAENGRQALEYLRSGARPGLILLDLMMPVMNGWEFRRQQTQTGALAQIPVAVMTAAGEAAAKSLGAEEVLPKPLPIERVLRIVQQYC